MKNIYTILPTRGLIFAQTIRSLQKNGITDIPIIDNLPIPDAQNEGVRQFLKSWIPYALFIEDDMDIPERVIDAMVKVDKPVVACDYPMDNGYSTICRNNDEILWCGLGCTLIKRGVFTNMKDPWFDTSYSWKIESEQPLKLTKIDNPYKYGGLDINFCIKVREAGFILEQVPGFEAKHLRCSILEKANGNAGTWDISSLPSVSKRQEYGKNN